MRVVIADDHRLMLDGIRRALEADGGFEIAGETLDGREVLPIVERERPDLLLLDARMPHVDGLAALDEIRRRHPEVKVALLSASTSPELVESARRHGASGFVAKSIDPTELPEALRRAQQGKAFSRACPAAGGSGGRRGPRLTEREVSILRALAVGLSNEKIAKELWVTRQTVKFHLTNIYRKLGVTNRTEATHRAYQYGLIDSALYGE